MSVVRIFQLYSVYLFICHLKNTTFMKYTTIVQGVSKIKRTWISLTKSTEHHNQHVNWERQYEVADYLTSDSPRLKGDWSSQVMQNEPLSQGWKDKPSTTRLIQRISLINTKLSTQNRLANQIKTETKPFSSYGRRNFSLRANMNGRNGENIMMTNSLPRLRQRKRW